MTMTEIKKIVQQLNQLLQQGKITSDAIIAGIEKTDHCDADMCCEILEEIIKASHG